MVIKIKDKNSFIKNLLSPISNLNDSCILKLSKNFVSCTLASSDSTIVMHGTTEVEYDGDERDLNISDIKKFTRLLQCLPRKDVTLQIESNVIKYNDGEFKFMYHLLEDGILKQQTLDIEKIRNVEYDLSFVVSESKLSTLLKGSMFTNESSRLYLFMEDNKILGEIGDRNKHNCNSFACEISNKVFGSNLETPIPLNFETFKLLSFNNKDINFKINNDLGIVLCEIYNEESTLIYIIASLIN